MVEAFLRFAPEWHGKEEFVPSFLSFGYIEQPFFSGRGDELSVMFSFVCCLRISQKTQSDAYKARNRF